MVKQILFDEEARDALKEGVDKPLDMLALLAFK